jgi:hypothetical protein
MCYVILYIFLCSGICLNSSLQLFFLYLQLAVSSSNKLYIWGSSPQVLRLQAQAQKKSRLLQQQQLLHSTVNNNSDISDPQIESPISGSAAKPDGDDDATKMHKAHQESNSLCHSPTYTEYSDLNLKPVLNCDSQLPSVDISHPANSSLLKNQALLVEASVNKKGSVSSHPERSSPVLKTDSNSTFSIRKSILKSVKCRKFPTKSNDTSEIGNGGFVNNQKQSSQSGRELSVQKGERICEVKMTQISDPEECMQKPQSSFLDSDKKQEDTESSSEFRGTSWNKNNLHPSHFLSQDFSRSKTQPSTCSLFSDFENANMDFSCGDLQLPSDSFASKRMDQNLELKVCFVVFLSILFLP